MAEQKKTIQIFDSTLRDGSQGEGISFSVTDRIRIAQALDELGVAYIEAGNPASNPKELEFFNEMSKKPLKNAKLVAFGSTRRKNIKAEDDKNLQILVTASTPAVAIFGKAWDFHVTEILKTTNEENLNMITDSVSFLKSHGKEVIFDAEHFFDGYKHNKEYALSALKAAEKGGADVLCLCDTNGGCMPDEVFSIVKEVKKQFKRPIAIHTHDDTGMAVANAVMAVKAGAVQVQGTIIGFGERCGNTNLSTVIGNLQTKENYICIPEENLSSLTTTCRKVAEISNVRLQHGMPYVGKSAFTHKAGMHIDGVTKAPESFEHIPPETVGNNRRFLMSEVAGRSTLIKKIQKFDASIQKDDEVATRIINKVKIMEMEGYQFEGADASFELLIRKQLGTYKPFFEIGKFKTIAEQNTTAKYAPATAVVKVTVNGVDEITGAEGNGPVNALDVAIRKALERFYPSLKEFHLIDYKVRILDSKGATSAMTRVLIECTDGKDTWVTVGVSRDIIEASFKALVDAIEYKLIKENV